MKKQAILQCYGIIASLLLVWLSACSINHKSVNSEADTAYFSDEMVVEEPVSNTESYAPITENAFLEASANPLSTFSVDVDRASYSNARRFIQSGELPPVDAVRIEELVNYFDYTYAQPTVTHPFAVHTELSACPWNTKHQLLQIGLQGKQLVQKELPPSNLVFLIDVSGSMNTSEKLPLLKQSLTKLVENLREKDRVAIVVYAGAAGLVLPSTAGADKEDIREAIENLEAGGSTAGGEGLLLTYQIAKEHFIRSGNNRIILATDGDFNVGPSSDAEMLRLIEEKRNEGVYLTVLGFGMGNYKDSKMEIIADNGNGNYFYIDSEQEAEKVFGHELSGTLFTIAKDVKIQVEFNPAYIKQYRLIGYENRLLPKEAFTDDRKDAGEVGAGHQVTALYEVELAAADRESVKGENLKYQQTTLKPQAAFSGELLTFKLRYKLPEDTVSKEMSHTLQAGSLVPLACTSDNFRFSAAVAAYGMLLRNSSYKGQASFEQVLELARGAMQQDAHGYRKEFVELVAQTEKLAETTARKE